jgi:acyl dehydratase
MLLLKSGVFKFLIKRLIYSNSVLLNNIDVGKSATLSRTILQEDVENFCELSGDKNPVHSGANAVVHGAFLNSIVSCVMGTQLPGPGSMVASQSIRYPNPCYLGETVTVSVMVTGMKADLIKCRYNVMAQKGDDIKNSRPVLTGEANLIMRDNQKRRAAKKSPDA